MRSIHALWLFPLVTLAAACADTQGGSDPVRDAEQSASADDGVPDDKSCLPPIPPNTCSDNTLGDGATCQSYGYFKTQATQDCAALGGALTDMSIDEEGCSGGGTAASYTCCVAYVDPDAPVCTGAGLGDGVTCVDDDTLHDQASALCADGTALVDMWLGHDCADGTSTIAKYLCCSS